MLRRCLLIGSILLAGCASFEPRIAVETHRPPASRTPPRAPPAPTPVAPQGDYVVARGDTLYGIAFRNRLDFRDLAAWNNIASPYTIYPGQSLHLSAPTRTTRIALDAAPRPATPSAATPPPALPQAVVVTQTAPEPMQQVQAPVPIQQVPTPPAPSSDSGTTQTFAVSDGGGAATPLAVTDAGPSTAVEPAPTPTTVSAKPPATTHAPASPAAAIGLAPTATSAPTAPLVADTALTAIVDPVNAPPDMSPRPVQNPNAPSRERDGLRWRWPVDGKVIGRFVEGDPTQQGVDLTGSLGQIVVAAADGDVVYSGNGLLGYGELVIVQHSPGYLSAYGHNRKRLVPEGVKVKAGQPIAELGRRAGIDMLHFEIRRNGKPTDPLDYLPVR
jgi:lipoprotein NlpD